MWRRRPKGSGARSWNVDAAAWKAMQESLVARRTEALLIAIPRLIGGADIAFSADGNEVLAIALVWDRLEDRVVEISRVRKPTTAPYIPGYLSFREGPALKEAIGQIKGEPGVWCFDGQGYAHPRRCGLAVHLGVELGLVSVGFAKSILIGEFTKLRVKAGSTAPLLHKGEQLGVALRTKHDVSPIYVSVGNRIDLPSAIALAMACTTRYRVPQPTRLADIETKRMKVESQ